MSDDLYDKGYLVAWPHYSNIHNDGTNEAETTAGLQDAINDARENGLVLYLPSGIYKINSTLKAYTHSTLAAPAPVSIVGSTRSTRPVIKLSGGTFTDPNTQQIMLDFKNFDVESPDAEKPQSGYFNMLRGVDIDCNQNAGCIGLHFNQAQDSTIENVKVTATGAHTGILGLPSRAYGAVNIEVVGGKYGIDTDIPHFGNVGSTIAGLKLTGQTENAIRHTGQALTIVGFEITTPANSSVPAITVGDGLYPKTKAHAGVLNLIDGKIMLAPSFSGRVAIANSKERNLYVRNVYVSGGGDLIQSASNDPIPASGTWNRIDEYSYANQRCAEDVGKETHHVIDGSVSITPPCSDEIPSNGEVISVTSNTGAPPDDLVSRHVWGALPSVDDSDCYDPVAAGLIIPGVVYGSTMQNIIDKHRKVFLPAGIYSLTSPITLHSDTILFGADRLRTRIEVASVSNWNGGSPVTSETALISTDDDASATTYIGDLTIGVPTDNNSDGTSRDWFTALDWRAGGNSMVHMGRPYHNPDDHDNDTNAHSLIKIHGSGGGRWYFLGRGQSLSMENADYRILMVDNTSQPLWIYGLDMEHARSDYFAQFSNASNVRIYGIKTEYNGEYGDNPNPYVDTTLLGFDDPRNVALFGHTAIRHSPSNHNSIVEFTGTTVPASQHGLLAASIVPQDESDSGGYLLRQNFGSDITLDYPNGLALYKLGTIGPADQAAMVHAAIGYGALPSPWSDKDIGGVGIDGSAYYGIDTYTVNASGSDIFGASDEFHFVSQRCSGNCSITARVVMQENTNSNARAGVMVRAGLGATSRFVNMHITPSKGTRFHYRSSAGSSVTGGGSGAGAAPYWVRLTRAGNTFVGETSSDGDSWSQVGSFTFDYMPRDLYFGLINTSHNDSKLNTSTFDNVSVE